MVGSKSVILNNAFWKYFKQKLLKLILMDQVSIAWNISLNRKSLVP